MGQEGRTRFAWTWAGVLAGVVLAGASYGLRAQEASRTQQAEVVDSSRSDEPRTELAQLTPPSQTPGTTTPAPGTTPGNIPGTTPGVGLTPGVTPPPAPIFNEDGGVGGAGTVGTTAPTVTIPSTPTGVGGFDAGFGGMPNTPSTFDTGGFGGSGLPFPSVGGGMDAGF
jgi:hypothetical protein